MSLIIKHPYHYAGGAITYEYVFPVRIADLPAIPPTESHPLLIEFDELTKDNIRAWWKQRSASIKYELSRTLGNVIDALTPVSLIVFESECWFRFQDNPIRNEGATTGKWLLVPLLDELPPLTNFPIHLLPDEKEFLDLFRTVWGYIPPVVSPWGTHLENSAPVVDAQDESWGGAQVRDWDGTLLFFTLDNGNSILLRQDGLYGLWNHESLHSPNRPLVRAIEREELLAILFTELGIPGSFD